MRSRNAGRSKRALINPDRASGEKRDTEDPKATQRRRELLPPTIGAVVGGALRCWYDSTGERLILASRISDIVVRLLGQADDHT